MVPAFGEAQTARRSGPNQSATPGFKSYAGEVLLALDPPYSSRSALRCNGEKHGGMCRQRAARRRGQVCLADHFFGIPDERHVVLAKVPRQPDGAEQCSPLGIRIRTRSKVVEEMALATDHDRGFHEAGVRAATAIEEYFQPAFHGPVLAAAMTSANLRATARGEPEVRTSRIGECWRSLTSGRFLMTCAKLSSRLCTPGVSPKPRAAGRRDGTRR